MTGTLNAFALPRLAPPANAAPAAGLGRALARAAGAAWGWVPLTPLGLAAVPLLVLAWRAFGGEQADIIVRVLCAGGLALAAVDVLAVLLAAVWLAVRPQRAAPPEALEAGLSALTGYRLGAVGWGPLTRVAVEWEAPAAAAAWVPARGGWAEQVTPTARGEADRVCRWFTVTDLFGLARVRFRRRQAGPVVVRPYQGRPSAYAVRELFRAGDRLGRPSGKPEGDLIEMRRYLPGDPLKLVLWKVYARTGTMLVRSPERAVDPTERTLAYLVAADGDEPAAGLARLALERGLLGPAVVFAADGAAAPARTAAEGVEQVVRSARHRAAGGADLDRFLTRGEAEGTGGCVLFVGHRPGPWLGRVAAALGRHAGPFRAVIGIDGPAPGPEVSRAGRLLYRRPPGDGPRARDLLTVAAALRDAGAEVMVVDRLTGECVAGVEE